jgi:hypothetical protein
VKAKKGSNDKKMFVGSIVFLLFCIAPTLVCCGPSLVSSIQYRADIKVIETRYTEFYDSYRDKNYETAFNYMSPEYRQSHTIEEFIYDFDFLTGGDWLRLKSGRSLRISDDKAKLYPRNQWAVPFLWAGPEYSLVKIDGEWYLTGEYIWYYD